MPASFIAHEYRFPARSKVVNQKLPKEEYVTTMIH